MKDFLELIIPAVIILLTICLFVFFLVKIYEPILTKPVYYERIKTGGWCVDVRFGTDKCFSSFEEARKSAPTSVLYEEEKDKYTNEN